MSDVTNSIQVQRGLGASNLAVASVGGTINVLTSAANMEKGGTFKQEFGSQNFLKTTLSYSTGKLDNNDIAASFLLQKKTGNGYVDGTWTDAHSYFFTANKPFGGHSFDFTLLGAPQQHGQRDEDNKHTIRDWESFDYHTGYGSPDNRKVNRGSTGSGWGYIGDTARDLMKEGSYGGESMDFISSALFGGNIQSLKKVGGKWLINNRTNYYHKPVYNLNWYWKINDKTKLSTILYGSNGRGGGTGPLNSRGYTKWGDGDKEKKRWKYINPKHEDDGTYDWEDMIHWNHDGDGTWADTDVVESDKVRWNEGKTIDPRFSKSEKRSKYIIRASVNHHNWYGIVSSLNHLLTDQITLSGGIDARAYSGIHYREVQNLLGGDYYVDYSDKNVPDGKVAKVGDKIAYFNTGYNKWIGAFGQTEYKTDTLSAFGSLAFSNTQYQREDPFNYKLGNEMSESANFPGYAAKVGANYNVNSQINVFGNIGSLSIAPNFRNVYLNYNNTVNPEAKNEKVAAFELGTGYHSSKFIMDVDYYHTIWQDKALVRTSEGKDGGLNIYNVQGLNANHSGIEFDGLFILNELVSLGSSISIGNWVWSGDVAAAVTDDYGRKDTYDVKIYSDGLHVGNAPQTQISGRINLTPISDLGITGVFKYFDNHYAAFDPENRNDKKRKDAHKLDSVSLLDLHAGYSMELASYNLIFGLHVLNLLDAAYASDGIDGKKHNAETTKIFYGLGRRINGSVSVQF